MKIFLTWLLPLLLLFVSPHSYAHNESKYHVLVLHSYNKGLTWTDNIQKGIEAAFAPLADQLDLKVEYMDSKIIKFDEKFKIKLNDLYEHKYSSSKFDVIISSDDNALAFLREYHKDIFPDTPIVFCGVNNIKIPNIIDRNLFTGILETTAVKETLELILQLHPNTKKVMIVCGNTPSGKARWRQIEHLIKDYPQLQFIRLDNSYSIDEIEEKVKTLPDDTIGIFATLYRDKNDQFISLKEGVERVSLASRRPFYTYHAQVLKYGTIGGKVLGGRQHGQLAAEFAQRIFRGEHPGDIPIVVTSLAQYMFNYEELQRFGIDQSKLPVSSIITNTPFSFYEEYKSLVWTALAIALILTLTICILILNIIKRQQAELELQKQKSYIQEALDAQNDTFFVFDPYKGMALQWNKAFEHISGYSSAEISSLKCPESYYSEEDLVKASQYIERVLNGDDGTVELELICKDGHRVPTEYSASLLIDSEGNPKSIISIGRDITDRQKAEEELSNSEGRFRRFAENATDVIYRMLLPDGKYEYVSPAAEKIFGYTPQEFYDSPILIKNMMHPDWVDYFAQQWEKLLTGEMPPFYEYQIIHKSGEVRWLNQRNVLVINDSGQPIAIEGIVTDITHRKQAEEEKEKLENRLQQAQKMEAIGTLAGGIAHDFNNILSTILGYAEMAQEDAPPDTQLKKDLDNVLIGANRAKELVKQILAFSRQTKTERFVLNLQPLIKEGLKMLRSSIPTTISFNEDIDPKAGTVLADPTQVHQILMNLCTNAYHSMEANGGALSVTLKTTVIKPDDQKMLLHLTPGEYVKFTVSDTGVGIGPDVIDKIFDPYYTTKEIGKGTGMGLAIIHGIMKEYGGAITAESQLGKGSTFQVYFPVVEESSLPEIKEQESLPRGKERVLFIDDEAILAEMGKDMLERLGYHVTVRHSSFEALETFQNTPDKFDLVITDQTMPGMTGADLARRILQLRPDVPIILCTGYSNLIDEDSAKGLGIKEFALKPLTTGVISKLIRKVLDGAV